MRRAIVLLVVALSLIASAATSATASQGGCAPGFTLIPVLVALRTVPGADGPAQAADVNGDGKVCVSTAAGGPRFYHN
jgi:hypothetical protein